MGRPPRAISFVLFVFWLGVSWQARVPHPAIPSNATVFSHVYTIKLAGESTEVEGASPPPQEALGPPSSSQGGGLFEHTLEGPDQEHVVFTHRINLPPQACGCPPGTEDTRELLRRLQALENEVRTLRDTCQAGGGCCPATASTQASTGQTDVRSLCSHHGSFDLSRCLCECEPGWGGPTCAEALCPGGCGGPERGKCVNGRCQCRPGYSGVRCEEPPSCPDDCNDQGRCVDGRCTCFQGYVGPSCSDPACPQGCLGHGQCVAGRCVCDPGYTGDDCGTRGCPNNCNRRGECLNGRCVCEPGFTGPACGTKACPNDCNQRGRCLKGAVCACHKGFTGPDCGQLACPEDCSGHGECENGVCLCHDGYSGDDCSIEIPSIGVRVANRDETSFRLEWKRPVVSVDGYEIHVVPTTQKDRQGGESIRLSGTETVFERRGLKPGEGYTVTVRAEKGQRYGPPVSQVVRTRVAPPHGLRSSQVTESTVTLQWVPPSSRPDAYILSYVPLVASRPAHATKRVELPAAPERVTLEELDHSTRYRITLIARQSGDSSRATSVVVSTTAPDPNQPVRHYSTPSPSSHRRPAARKPGTIPVVPSSGPDSRKPSTAPVAPSSGSESRKPSTAPVAPSSGSESRKPSTAPVAPSSGSESRKPGTAPVAPSSEPEDKKPGAKPHPSRTPSTLSAKELFLKKMTQNISAKLSPYKGTLLERLESYLRATNFPLQGDRTVESVAWDIYIYLIHRKPKEIQERVEERLIQETNHSFPIGGAESVYSDGYLRPEHVKPAVVASFPDGLEVSLDGVRGVSDNVVIRYQNMGNGEEGELVVPGDASSVSITGLAPGTTYHMEIHGVMKGKSSKSYSFITATAPASPTTAKTRTAPTPAPSPGVLLKDLTVTDVSPTSLRVAWSAPPSSFHSFSLQYKDPKSSAPLGEVRVPGTERSVNVMGLSPSTEYELQLHGQKPDGVYDAPLTAKTSTAPAAEAEKPSLGQISILEVTDKSARLSWDVPTGAFDSFLIQYKDAEGKPKALPVDRDSREAMISNLVPSRKYKFNLYGLVGRKRLGPVSTETVTASGAPEKPDKELTAPPSLGELSASDITSDTVRLSWSVPSGSFDSFLIQYKDAEGRPQVLPMEGDTREVTIPSLAPSRRYRFNLYGIANRKRLGPATTDVTTASREAEPIPEPVLGDLSIVDATSNSVRLTWSVPTGTFDSFLLQYQDPEGHHQSLPTDRDSREATIPNLAPSQRYRFNLYGISGSRHLGPISADAITAASQETKKERPDETILTPPSLGELSASDVTADSVRLSWTVPTGSFDSFQIQYKDAEGKPQALPVDGASREVTVPNLAPSRRYKFSLYGVSGRKRSSPISTEATTASQEVDEPVTVQPSLGELSASDVTPDSVRLSWTVPTGSFDSFQIQYKDAEGKPQALPVEGGSREATIPNLAPSRRYKFSLYGVSGRKRSSPISTEATTASREGEEPVAVQPGLGELSASDVTADSVRLSWTVPTGSFDSFLVQYKDAEGKPQALPVDGASREVTVPNLAPSRRYKFSLYGVSGRKRSSPISTEATTASQVVEETVAVQPSLGALSASDVTADSVRLSWTVPTGSFDSFLVQYKDANGKPQALPVEGGSREATVPNLAPSRRYKFSLYGVSGRKRSSPVSTEATTALQEVDEPVVVQPSLGALSASDVTPDSVRLSWTVPTGSFDSFQIQYKDAEGKPQALPIDGASREVTVPNLAPSRRYKFNLYGVSGRKRSSPISTEATTASQEVEEPSLGELSASDVSPDSVRLSWTVPTGSFDSFLVQYKDANGKPQALPVEGGSREVTVPNLAPSRRYKFSLYGVSGRKRSSPISTEATTASREGEEPVAVQPGLGELSASDVTADSVRLSWTVPTGSFDSFLVQYKDADGKPQALPVEGGSRELTVPNLAPSRRYKFSLYGVSGRKRSSPISTEATTASREGEEPVAVQPSLGELSASDVTPDSIRLSWTVPTGSFDSFLVQYKDANGRPQALPVEGGSRELTVPNLAPSHRYKFSLYGISGRKRSSPISTEATTAATATSPEVTTERVATIQLSLEQLMVSDLTSTSARLSWAVPTGDFDSFLVQYEDAHGRPRELPVDGVSRTLAVPDLEPSQRYQFNLYGVYDGKQYGPLSVEAVTAPAPVSPEGAEVLAPQPSLGELTAFDIFSDSLRLSWTVPTGSFDSFLVEYRDAEGRPQTLPVDGGSREVTVSSLVPSRRYKFNLFGISGHKQLGPLSTDAVTAPLMEKPTPPLRLGELTAGNAKPNSLDLSWTVAAGNFDSFIVQYRDAQGKAQALPVEGNLRSLHLHDLVPSHRYHINLYGVSGRKRLGPISTQAETAPSPTAPPAQPSLGELSASDVTADSVRLSWTVPTGSFDSFQIQYKDVEGKPQALPVEGGSREVTVPNLAPSRRYKFNLYGLSGRKRLGPVSADTVTASPVQEPPTLGELSASDVTTSSVRLSWSVLTGRFDTFLVQYKDAEGKPQAIPVEGDFREILIPNLAPSRRYKFNLYGLTGRKRLGPVSTDAITAAPPAEAWSPHSLEQLSVSEVTRDSAHLTWTVRTGTFDSFVVQYKDAEGKTQALPLDGNIYETTVTGLSPSRRYKFNLYGLVGRKRLGPVSMDTVTASAAEKEDTVKPSLGELSASDVTPDSVLLSWTVPTGSFESFQIQYKDTEGKPQMLPVDGASREVTVPNLAPSRRYKFNLYGVSGQKRLGPISSEATTAAREKEDEEEEGGRRKPSLGELSVSEAGHDSVRLSWSVPAGRFDSFLVQYEGGEEETQTLPVDGGSREVTVPNLEPSQRYRFDLYGISGGEYVGPVSTDAFTAPSTPQQDVEEKGTATPAPEPNLGELSVSDVTSDSVRLSWNVPPGTFDSFLVQYKDAENRPQSLPVDKETNWVVIYYLVPSYRYKFNLYGISGRKRFGPTSVSIATVTTEHVVRDETDQEVSPGTEPRLGELSVSDVTSNAARLSWSVPTGSFDSFSIQYKDAEGRPQALPVGGGSREVIVPNLAPSHKYRFNLYGISGQRRLGPISANAVTTASTDHGEQREVGEEADQEVSPGTEPRLGELSVSDITSNAARLSWSVPAGSFDSFSVQYKDAEGRPQALPVGGGSREVIVPNLAPSHKYRFNLYGISGQRRLGPISANAVTTAAKTPGQTAEEKGPEETPDESVQPRLGDVTVSEITPDSLLLSWSIQEGSFDSFLIQYKDAAGKLQMLPVDGAMRSLHLYNLTPSQRYKFNIFGVSGHKRLGPISIDAVTEASQEENTVQPRLGELSVSTVTSDSVSLSWSVPAGSFHSFLVQFKDAEGRPQVLPLNGDSRDVTVPGLTPSHRYKFNLYGISGHKRLGPISTDAVTAPGTHPAQLKLGELSAHNVTSESLLLSWTVETGNFNSFIIQYRGADGKPHALPVDGSLRSLRLHDLLPSHRYRFNLYGVSGRKRFGPVPTEATTGASEHVAPPQPNLGELSASDINSTSVRLSWTVLAGDFDSFIIQYRDAEGKPQALPVDASSRDVIVSKLAPSRKYKFNLYGISGRKRFGPSSTEAVTARTVAPEIGPTLGDLSISEVTKESVRLSWTISAGKFDSFLVQYKDTEGNTQTVPVDVDSRTVVISDLEHSHRYKFNLYGISGRKRLGPISTDAVTAFPDAPSEPAALLDHLVVSEVTPTTLHLTWEAPEGGFDSFLVQYKDSLQGSGRIPLPAKEVKVPGDETTATLRGLTPNTEYSLTLYGIKDGSEAANINTAARTSGLELDSPRDLRFSDIRETSVLANWRAPSSRIDRYKVSFQPSDGGEPRSISVDGSKLKTTIGDLTPGASYEVTVMSIRGFEESEPLVGYVTTVPDGPSDLRAINVTDSSAVLTWHPPVAEMNNYIVTYGPIGGPRVSESVPGNRVQLRLSELRLDTEYRTSIYGEKEGNRSSPVSATFTTGADGPRDLRATEVSPRSARLTWSPPRAPPGGYLLSYETPYGQSKEIPLDASITSYELQNLIPSSRYQVQVQALRRGTPTAPTSTSFTTGHLTYPFPRDCSEESQNGPGPSRVTTIYLGGNRDRPLQVYCDMETDGGGWIVFQRRMNGETDFWRDWQDYAKGFGDLSREFWLGNDALHQLTTSGDYELRVDLRAKNESVYATYQHFRVDPPADYYRLHLGSYSGTAGDAFSYHSGSVFSTRDRDPNRLIISCAVSYRGAWWYRNCHYTNLNGLYSSNRDHQGVNWFNWKGFEFSIPFTEMKLRPRGFQPLRWA